MLRKLTYIFLLIAFTVNLSFAETVNKKEALNLASLFFNEANGQVMGNPKEVNFGRGLTTNRLFIPFYIFTHPKGGFVIISAENKTFPILAYSLTDKFDASKVSPPLQAILSTYARDIENIRYDSSIPTEAIEAWNNPSNYIGFLVKSAKNPVVFENKSSLESAQNIIDSISAYEENFRFSSSLYSPDQWKDLILQEIKEKGNSPIGFLNIKGEYIGANANGYSNDFVMINLPGMSNSFFRLNASEILSEGMISNIEKFIPEPPEEEPFTYYESFITEFEKERIQKLNSYSIFQYPEEPSLAYNGAGHFNIFIPEEVASVSVYNLTGAKIAYYKFNNTNNANIDISIQPNGFYFAQVVGKSGKKYGFKLLR